MYKLKDKVAIVTGGSKGIGAGIARQLAADGAKVIVNYASGKSSADNVVADIQAAGGQAVAVAADVTRQAEVEALVNAAIDIFGRLDIVVNNAGGSPQAQAATASPRFSERIVQLNLLAPLHVSQATYPHLRASGGSIINIASVSAVRPSPDTAIYGAAKAGLLNLTTSLAQEWGPEVRVNAIIVGLIETESAEMTYGSSRAQERIAASLPLGRMGRGGDVAEAVLFLASPAAAYISGAQLAVHGGGERPLFLEIVKQEAAAAPADQ